MNIEQEFINTYIETMSKKIEDLVKSEILLNAQMTIIKKQNELLNTENEKLKIQLEEKVKKPKKEVNTSEF